MNESDRRARLIDWLDIIFRDVQSLLLDDHIFWEVQNIVDSNPRFATVPGLFTHWMTSAFAQATANGVRRQAKADKRSASLKRFLLEIQKYPCLVSRAHYVSLFQRKPSELIAAADSEFDDIAGKGRPYLPTVRVQKDLAKLTATVEGIEHYVDRRIAHYDMRNLAHPKPTFGELSDALKTLEKLVVDYWSLLKWESMQTILPTIQYDWKDIFRFTWEAPHQQGGAEFM